jgi:hypothetical protein
MVRIGFAVVEMTGYKSGKCKCGKHRRRQKTFSQTINPFNKNAEGMPKSREEIYQELKETIAKWKKEPITCEDCCDD